MKLQGFQGFVILYSKVYEPIDFLLLWTVLPLSSSLSPFLLFSASAMADRWLNCEPDCFFLASPFLLYLILSPPLSSPNSAGRAPRHLGFFFLAFFLLSLCNGAPVRMRVRCLGSTPVVAVVLLQGRHDGSPKAGAREEAESSDGRLRRE